MNEAAFEQIAGSLRERALSASRALGLGEMDADDVAQDTLLKLWSMRQDLGRYRSLPALSTLVARHLAIDRLRAQRPTLPVECMWDQAGADSADAQVQQAEADEWLSERLSALPGKQKLVLQLRQVEHRSYAEIAALIGINETSARVLISRARKTLLEEFKNRMK